MDVHTYENIYLCIPACLSVGRSVCLTDFSNCCPLAVAARGSFITQTEVVVSFRKGKNAVGMTKYPPYFVHIFL